MEKGFQARQKQGGWSLDTFGRDQCGLKGAIPSWNHSLLGLQKCTLDWLCSLSLLGAAQYLPKEALE